MNSRQFVRRKAFGIEPLCLLRVGQQRAGPVWPNAFLDAQEGGLQPHGYARIAHDLAVFRIDIRSAAKGDNGPGSLRQPLQVVAFQLSKPRFAETREYV